MKTIRLIVLGGVLALASSAAWAFQEQQGGAAPAADKTAPAAQAAPAANLGTMGAPAEKSAGGTEIRIPGLGRLGMLPKMDFGLELLYGAAESRRTEEQRGVESPGSDDLTIRGTLRRKF